MSKVINRALYYIQKPNQWSTDIGADLPEAYKKFWTEWKRREPTAVHYIRKEGKYYWDENAQQVYPVQNTPLPLRVPKELHNAITGGEAIVQGFKKKSKKSPIYPAFWFPRLKRSVVYSEVLDEYMRAVVTARTINLIHEHYGLDHYLLKTPACDLVSELALKIKRKILIALADRTLYPDDPVKREDVYNKYSRYLSSYTREEIEWYGLSWKDACKKVQREKEEEARRNTQPLKIKYRAEVIEKLKAGKIDDLVEIKIVEEKPTLLSRILRPRLLKAE